MSQVEIFIDPKNPAHSELEQGLRQSLNALTSVSVKEERRPVPAGTLVGGIDQVFSFVIQHPDKAVVNHRPSQYC
jgi:hypothetical protein